METLVLSNPATIKEYFEKIFELHQSGEPFPAEIDEVWPLVYSRKDKAVEHLKQYFLEGVDYQLLPQKVEQNGRGGHNKIDYQLSANCIEYFIARKVRAVFDVYHQVFHKKVNPVQFTLKEALKIALVAEEAKEAAEQREKLLIAENNKKDAVIEYLEPDAIVGKKLTAGSHCIEIGTFAKSIDKRPRKFFEQLRSDKILMTGGEKHNQPYALYKDWFDYKPKIIDKGPRKGEKYYQTKVTPTGQKGLILFYRNKEKSTVSTTNQLSINTDYSLSNRYEFPIR